MVTKMDNSIKKGKLIVIKIDKCRASMGLLSTAEKERRGITLIATAQAHHAFFSPLVVSVDGVMERGLDSQCNNLQTGFPPDGANLIVII